MTRETQAADDRALAAAWAALDAAPESFRAKLRLHRLLRRAGHTVAPGRIDDLARLARDPAFDPVPFAQAGWRALAAGGRLPTPDESGAQAIETDEAALALLGETSVATPDAERTLSALRRWLLLSRRGADFPRLAEALRRQAERNGGAWPFDADERARLADGADPLVPAYLPPRPTPGRGDYADPTTAAVATQYEGWPYPTWERLITFPEEHRLEAVRTLDPRARATLEGARHILVAGCGTGAEALTFARLAPHARVTAIDLSDASLAVARARCDAPNIDFRKLDLHRVAELGIAFDVIASGGVLHHLPDPEAGGAALLEVLRPGGAMLLLLYSRIGRLPIYAARRRVADLLDRPVDDDLIRAARARLIAAPSNPLANSTDFYSLADAYDLLLHEHEDAFDLARIRRFVEAHGLDLLGFVLNGPGGAAYRAAHPHDPGARDYAALQRAELGNPNLFHGGMYQFWCARPA